jgi:hypothetical protein
MRLAIRPARNRGSALLLRGRRRIFVRMEKPAETTTPKEKRSINWGALILWPVVILILYVLSWGPVIMMIEKGHISSTNEFLRMFYRPLGWAYAETPLHKPLGMYFHLWAPQYFDKKGDKLVFH